ncbi:fatty acid desaturase [Sphingobium sp. AR-3-1]|uniref:Fatty acid desaturase n=1 Tax=Sphingobium psychrophilum TaxID=2728834 RepID=A0A7X9X071_9SPHN|nr:MULTISPECIES: fatty acid desaturase [Sphingobium]NML13152.1 fatty acid desaturase [Sphingobium psychrophilum]
MVASAFPKSQQEYFEQLRQPPVLALPTALLFVASMGGIGCVWYLSLTGKMPIWLGTIANGLITYLLFSVIHDAAHYSLSRVKWLNESIGAIGLFFLFPYAPMVLLRWVHNKHHSYANGPLDPDRFEHESPWWQVPFRWTFFDGAYIHYFLKRGQSVRKRHGKELVLFYSGLLSLFVGAIYFGFGFELFMLWFLPSRITLFLIAVVFVILPHYPAMVAQDEQPYMATTMRYGWEWLLTPLLVYQNYHLIHHLYPEIPFYRMHRAYFVKYDEINRQDISRQTAFGLKPENIASHLAYRQSRDSTIQPAE